MRPAKVYPGSTPGRGLPNDPNREVIMSETENRIKQLQDEEQAAKWEVEELREQVDAAERALYALQQRLYSAVRRQNDARDNLCIAEFEARR